MSKSHKILLSLFALFTVAMALNNSGGLPLYPLLGRGDVGLWEFMGGYFAENVRFFPYPHIIFDTDTVFYPYGVNVVFQPWGVERELFYSFFNVLLGFKGALALYHFLSQLITCFGVYFLFRSRFGEVRAAVAGFAITFFNFYAMAKFPGHLNMSVVHWTSLSICLDYLIIYRLFNGEGVSLRIALGRMLLLFLSVGQTLGYVASYALLSFTVMAVVVLGYILVMALDKENSLSFSLIMPDWLGEFRNHRRDCLLLLVAAMAVGLIYIPLDLSIYLTVKSFEQPDQVAMWSSPWRVLIPWFPWFNPRMLTPELLQIFKPEWSEGLSANTPGYFLLLSAAVGLVWSRVRTAGVFLVILFLLALTNHPYETFSLSHLPWMKFARVGSRISIILAPVLGLFLLSIPFEKIKTSRLVQLTAVVLLALGCLELYTFTSLTKYRTREPGGNFYQFMDTVAESKGEAVLDWPFCVAAGNGVGTSQLGRYYGRNNFVPWLTRFHGKKVMGLYSGRLTRSMLTPYLVAGFDKMFVPDNLDYNKAERQARPMTNDEWIFFDRFFTLNDFAGINLYTDLVHPDDVQKFYDRFGKPVVKAEMPGVKEVVFIPKDSVRRAHQKPRMGRKLMFLPPLNSVASLSRRSPAITAMGFALAKANVGLVWASENSSYLVFRLPEDRPMQLAAKGILAPGAEAQLRINDQLAKLPENFSFNINFQGKKGLNRVEVVSPSKGRVAAFQDIQISPAPAQ